MGMFTLAACTPSVYIEAFASWQPPLTQLFWASRYKFEFLAFTVVALRLFQCLSVVFEEVTTETFALGTYPKALVLFIF
jgi:hypothetical protein